MGKLPRNFGHLLKVGQCTIPPLQVNDITITDSYPKAKAFNNYLRSVFTNEDTSPTPHMEGAPFQVRMPSIPIPVE